VEVGRTFDCERKVKARLGYSNCSPTSAHNGLGRQQRSRWSKIPSGMAYISQNYASNPKAPIDRNVWVGEAPYYGQCVSYVKFVTPGLPQTSMWRRGLPVKGNRNIVRGTVIATFNAHGQFSGHAAIYESRTPQGIKVVDQWITPPPQPIHRRLLMFGAHGNSNNGDNFYVVE
jgi:hypothetical protein